ncbi:MAG: AmmeMemoRadiSam system protein A [Candidatus Pacearchaeota archaeon]
MEEKIYNLEEQKKLLQLARQAIEEELNINKPTLLLEIEKNKLFREFRGIFVTLKKNGKLRGCIGFPYATNYLYKNVYEAAKEAAFNDPRFLPVTKDELDKIKIEISILTKPTKVNSLKEIVIGKDGLMCKYLTRSALLLPQVAKELNLNKIEFLEALCDKAGLPKGTWQQKGFELYKFQAQIFSE